MNNGYSTRLFELFELILEMDIAEYLQRAGVIKTGDHFVYTKGGHGESYVNIKGLTDVLSLLPVSIYMAHRIYLSGFNPDVIVGIPHGADVLASQVAIFYSLFSNRSCMNLKLMKNGEDFMWYKDHGDYARGKASIFVEDVVNTGGSLVRCGKFIKDQSSRRGCIIGCDRLSDKNPGLTMLGKEFEADYTEALVSVDAANYTIPDGADPRDYCPHCKAGRKINTKIGHGKSFLEKIRITFPDLHQQLS